MALSQVAKNHILVAIADRGSADEVITTLNAVAALSGSEAAFIDNVVAGTFAASKAMVLSSGGDGTMPEGGDIAVGTTTGTKLGTAVAQKLGFWNATPVIQQASADQTAVTNNTGGSVADAIAAVVTAPTAIAATLTDSTGDSGTHDDVLADGLTATAPAAITNYAAVVAMTDPVTKAEGEAVSLALATLEDEVSALRVTVAACVTDLTVQNQNDSDLAQKVMELVTAQAADRLAIIALTDGLAKTIELVNAVRAALTTTGIIKGAA